MIRNRNAILALLTGLNFLNYIDRAVVAAVVNPMKLDLGMSNLEAGLVNTAFLIGYFVTAPLFGARADKGPRKGLIALGVAIWSAATVASGLANSTWTLILARIVVGVGEASYASLAPTIIDDLTPPDQKGKALAVFYLAIPLGYAMGYVLGGTIADQWGWRSTFFICGGPGIVLALSCLLIVEPARKLTAATTKLVDSLRNLAKLPLFRRAMLGYCAYTAAVGAFSYWAPNYLVTRFPARAAYDAAANFIRYWVPQYPFASGPQLTDAAAGQYFGVVLLAAGAVGTVIGGRWADRSQLGLPVVTPETSHEAPANRVGINALLRICALGMVLAAPLTVIALFLPLPWMFFALSFVIEIGLFLSTSPVNAALLRAVPNESRASAMAASIFAIHLFGDLWSSALLGVLLDVLPLVVAMMALPLAFAASALIWWPRAKEAGAA